MERPARRSVEGLEGLALQRGLDPADPALASSSADVPRGWSPSTPAGQGRSFGGGGHLLYLGSPHTVCSLNSALKISFNWRNGVQLRSAEEKKSSHLTRSTPPGITPPARPKAPREKLSYGVGEGPLKERAEVLFAGGRVGGTARSLCGLF